MRALKKLAKFIKDETGVIMILWGLMLPMIMGGVGLGIEASNWYQIKRNLQSSADAAAIAAAFSISSGANLSTVAGTEMTRNGYGSSNGVSITVNRPPGSGSYTGNNNAVEVIVTKTEARALSATLMAGNPTIYARSVALKQTTGTACVLALDASHNAAIDASGGAQVNMSSCVIASNSNASSSIKVTGGATLTVDSAYSAGGITVNGGGSIVNTNANTTYGSTISDPYSGINAPSHAPCDQNNYSLNSGQTATISEGVYCNGFSVNGGATVHMNPGTYVIDRGSFSINGGATLTGTGVTIILTDTTGSSPGQVSINGGANVTLSAQTSGAYSGILFYQDRNHGGGSDGSFNGGANISMTGALYYPMDDITFNGGASTGGSCIQIIAQTVTFNGGTNLSSGCSGTGVTPISLGSAVKTVE